MTALNLNQAQLSALTAAAARSDGAIVPPHSASDRTPLRELIVHGLVNEIHVEDQSLVWRKLRGRNLGLVIADEGRDAIEQAESDLKLQVPPGSKLGQVVLFLQRPHGASLSELTALTGWQPHSVRAAISTLRKKGMDIVRHEDGVRTYYRATDAELHAVVS